MAQKGIYEDHLKCCTYFPFLTNYSLGAILESDLKSKDLISEMIEKREFVLPLGLVPNWKYKQEFKDKALGDFGNNENLLCPFFLKSEKSCSIWPYRNSACQSFQCEYETNSPGPVYWDIYSEAFHFMEMSLSQFILGAFGYNRTQINVQLNYLEGEGSRLEPNKVALSESEFKAVWGDHYGNESQFFKMVFEFQQKMSYEDYIQVLGSEGLKLFVQLKMRLLKNEPARNSETNY
jgi:Fe-S-cluster containining protein